MPDIELSHDQKAALEAVMQWHKSASYLMCLGGFAGTGKTTLVAQIRKVLPKYFHVAYCCFTGKATSVLNAKLQEHECVQLTDICSTVHSLIYRPVLDPRNKKIIGWELKPPDSIYADLIILDEASMVNEELFADLSSYGIPILAIGDHGQLPPVSGSLNLMDSPDICLETIHRQAENNPIIKISMMARLDGYIPYGGYASTVAKVSKGDPLINQFLNNSRKFEDTIILCGFNSTRIEINKKMRKTLLGETGSKPCVGDRVLCLLNNREAKDCPIYNGVLGTMKNCGDQGSHYETEVAIDGENNSYFGPMWYDGFHNAKPDMYNRPKVNRIVPAPGTPAGLKMSKEFVDVFDFGYCLSVHKSQGSEWKKVLLFEQPCRYWAGKDWNRWLYTAVTRAKEQLLIVR